MGKVTFEAGLVRQTELRTGANDTPYTFLTLARNYSRYDKEKREYIDEGAIFVECALFGHKAKMFAESNVPLGTNLIVSGTTSYKAPRSYVNASGQTVEVPAGETVNVDSIGIIFGAGQRVSVTRGDGTQRKTRKAPIQEQVEKAEKAKQVKKEVEEGQETGEVKDTSFEEIFGDLDDFLS